MEEVYDSGDHACLKPAATFSVLCTTSSWPIAESDTFLKCLETLRFCVRTRAEHFVGVQNTTMYYSSFVQHYYLQNWMCVVRSCFPPSYLSTGIGLSKLVSPSTRRTLRSLAMRGIKKKSKSNQVILVRTDSTSSENSSSSSCSSSPSSKSTPSAGGRMYGGTNGRSSQGDHDSSRAGGGGGGTGDASGGCMGAGQDRRINLSDDSNSKAMAPCRRHSGSSARKSGRIACSDGRGDDSGMRTEEHPPPSEKSRDGVGSAGNGSKHDRGSSGGGNVTARIIDALSRCWRHCCWGLS